MDVRSKERIAYHYSIEKSLAARLRQSTRADRKALYMSVYDELFREIPDYQQWQRKGDTKRSRLEALRQFRFIRRFLGPEIIFMELGAGDCALSKQVADKVRTVFAVDVAEVILTGDTPSNLHTIVSDGISVPLPRHSVHIAYSNQLMEHLHPEDAREQLTNILDVIAPGGIYICVTPNRLSGPHDISRHFDDCATGLHLKEYTISELTNVFYETGFANVKVLISWHSLIIPWLLPVLPFIMLERLLGSFPSGLRRIVSIPIGAAKLIGYKTYKNNPI